MRSSPKSLSFIALPKPGSDPVQTRRTKFITKLEEQKLLLKEPNHARTVQRCSRRPPQQPLKRSRNLARKALRAVVGTGLRAANIAIYWNATSAKLLSLRECSRSRSWDSSFSSARRPISRC